uniref:Uncharacterized protein n=1 Tax=Arundo donax TaxID=35708 RepID=A0A0A9E854_ARUDO
MGCHHKHRHNSPNFLSNQAYLWTLLACQMVVFPHRANHFLHNPRLFLRSHWAFNLPFLLHHNQLISVLSRVLEWQSKLLALQHLLLCTLARYHGVLLLQNATRWVLLILSRISLPMHYLVWMKRS